MLDLSISKLHVWEPLHAMKVRSCIYDDDILSCRWKVESVVALRMKEG